MTGHMVRQSREIGRESREPRKNKLAKTILFCSFFIAKGLVATSLASPSDFLSRTPDVNINECTGLLFPSNGQAPGPPVPGLMPTRDIHSSLFPKA